MSRRRRALAFLGLALAAAVAAGAVADRYGASVARGYGPLRPVVVLNAGLAAGKRLGPGRIAAALAVRRVPERFVPPGALASPAEARGLTTATALPAGSYLLVAQLRRSKRRGVAPHRLGGDRGPVEIAVSGAEALLTARSGRAGTKVDVVVTSEPSGPGPGRTYIAARRVPLLALRPGVEGAGPGGTSAATLGLTRRQALRLIAAESFARKLTLLAGR